MEGASLERSPCVKARTEQGELPYAYPRQPSSAGEKLRSHVAAVAQDRTTSDPTRFADRGERPDRSAWIVRERQLPIRSRRLGFPLSTCSRAGTQEMDETRATSWSRLQCRSLQARDRAAWLNRCDRITCRKRLFQRFVEQPFAIDSPAVVIASFAQGYNISHDVLRHAFNAFDATRQCMFLEASAAG